MTDETTEPLDLDEPDPGAGWSIQVGALRTALAGVPDDYEVVLTNAEVEDCEIAGLALELTFPPASGAPGLIVLSQGQVITSEYRYHPRLDDLLDRILGPTDQHTTTTTQ